jgi:predicted DNA-binding transcriptional regulator YafY
MRADRLISLLMFLQTRGRMTAHELAEELEVSERTIYRDIEALSTAGVPIYTTRGPGGGCALLDSYRTDLTGFTDDEIRALFMLSIPAPLTELGVSRELEAALLKLSAALPATRRYEDDYVRQRIHLDSIPWFHPHEPVPHLQTIHKAIWQNRRLHLTRRLIFETHVEQLVDPLGLVAKAAVWYLVCAIDDQIRIYRVSHVVDAHISNELFQRPIDFSLASFWNERCAKYEYDRPHYQVTIRVAPNLIPILAEFMGDQIQDSIDEPPSDSEGWKKYILRFESFEAARSRILSFGRAMEVLEPQALRKSIHDFANQIVDFYGR